MEQSNPDENDLEQYNPDEKDLGYHLNHYFLVLNRKREIEQDPDKKIDDLLREIAGNVHLKWHEIQLPGHLLQPTKSTKPLWKKAYPIDYSLDVTGIKDPQDSADKIMSDLDLYTLRGSVQGNFLRYSFISVELAIEKTKKYLQIFCKH